LFGVSMSISELVISVCLLATVYIADSDSAVGRSIQFLLETDNISARVFTKGQGLLECARSSPPGCIVADAALPDISGLTLLKRLREEGLTTPVIILSGSSDVPSVVEAVRTGAWDYFEKPFMQRVLLDSVKRAMKLERTR
jgi:two-component system response regulator FixJ